MSLTLENQLIHWRRELHQHPELSDQEFATTARIQRWLDAAGIKRLDYGLKTGVVAEIGAGEPLIALRADIDALPIEETTGQPFASQQPGVMHACGHDLHTSVMLGAAQLLKAREHSLPGRVRILFQPAEEIFTGAQQLIDAGALDGVQAIFGMHNAPDYPLGTLKTRGGAFYANVDRFVIRVTGKRCARGAAAGRRLTLSSLPARSSGRYKPCPAVRSARWKSLVVSVTRISGGNTWNVLPGHCRNWKAPCAPTTARCARPFPSGSVQLIEGISAASGAQAVLGMAGGSTGADQYAALGRRSASRSRATAAIRLKTPRYRWAVKILLTICGSSPAPLLALAAPASMACTIRASIPVRHCLPRRPRYFDRLAGDALAAIVEPAAALANAE